MLYRLLRNNIESGPFTKDELMNHGLLASDQIKLEGEAHWHAPHAFNEFKDITSHFPKPKFKITANKEVIEIKEEKKEDTNPASSEKKAAATPFKRVPSAIPRNRNEHFHEEDVSRKPHTTVKASVEDIESAPRLEKRERKVPTIQESKKAPSSNFKKEVIIPISILVAIGFIAFFIYKKLTAPSSLLANPTAALSDSSAYKIAKTDTIATQVPKSKTATTHHLNDSSHIAKSRDSLNKQIDTISKVATVPPPTHNEDSEISVQKTAVANEESSAKKAVAQSKKQEKEVTQTTKSPEKKSTRKKGKSINDFVALSLNKLPNKEVRNIKIRIKNISDQSLNIAVIDVKYLDANGNMLTGETLEANNIGAGKTVTVRVPNNKEAANITYKVSLISGDSLYLMAP